MNDIFTFCITAKYFIQLLIIFFSIFRFFKPLIIYCIGFITAIAFPKDCSRNSEH